jgi:hypothetical protein
MYVGTTNSKPPGPIIMIDQSETDTKLGPIYYTLFWRCTTVLRLLPAQGKLHECGAEKPIS